MNSVPAPSRSRERQVEEERSAKKTPALLSIVLSLALTGAVHAACPLHAAWQEQEGEMERGRIKLAARVNGVETAAAVLQKTFERNTEERGIDLEKINSRARLAELIAKVYFIANHNENISH